MKTYYYAAQVCFFIAVCIIVCFGVANEIPDEFVAVGGVIAALIACSVVHALTGPKRRERHEKKR